jgi:5-(carboxyamino)imidazole ribonucleotide synthase
MTPETESPASSVAHRTFVADYEDPEQLVAFSKSVDVITTEFENISATAVARASEYVPVRPNAECLKTAQHRIREKSTLSELGFPVSPFVPIYDLDDIEIAAKQLRFPMVLKTASWGYDGKGQRKVTTLDHARQAASLLGPDAIIAEAWVNFVSEVSILVARNADGEIAVYPLVENEHSNHILDVSRCPVSADIAGCQTAIHEIAMGVIDGLGYVGLLCIEFFVMPDGSVMINEIAPRPHNSGHLTLEACGTSQFEMQLRAICNLPLGTTSLLRPAAMVNLLGDLWATGEPHFDAVMRHPNCHLHLYGKTTPRAGRKMGHITCLADTAEEAVALAKKCRSELSGPQPKLFNNE